MEIVNVNKEREREREREREKTFLEKYIFIASS